MYRFAGRELDPLRRELRFGTAPVHLEPQAFDLLVHLVEHRHRVVAKHELLTAVWGHEFLSDAVLTTRIKEIRRAVGDDGRTQGMIRNYRGRGYRFVARVDDPSDTDVKDVTGDTDVAPAVTTGLLGRDDDLRRVSAALAAHRFVTVTGAGGVGKSTLARAVVGVVTERFPDGVHVVDLSALAPGEPPAPVVARALDVAFTADRSGPALRTVARLAALLVLDECEAHLGTVAGLVRELLDVAGSSISVLATSRVRVGVGGEAVVRLAPLDPATAADLFVRVATGSVAGRDAGTLERADVDAVVARLDHLPLAIEMAAARLGTMSLAELDVALGSPGGLAHLADHGMHHRRGGLEQLVAGSVDALTDEQRRRFVDCAVFAGRFGADDVDAVSPNDTGTPTVMTLSWLAECSLLQSSTVGGVTRYRMLTTVREVAAVWLARSGRATTVHERHARRVLDRLDRYDHMLRTAADPTPRDEFDDLVVEVRAAHRWASVHRPAVVSELCGVLHLPAYTGLWHEPAGWAAEMADGGTEGCGARIALAGLETHRGELRRARARLAPDLATASGRDLVDMLEVLADAAMYEGDLSHVLELADRLGVAGDEQSDPYAVTMARVFRALALTYGGDATTALDVIDSRSVAIVPVMAQGWLHFSRGEVYGQLGRCGEAIEEMQRAVGVGTSTGHTYLVSVARMSWSTMLGRSGDTDGALDVLGVCLAESRRNGNLVHALTAMRNLVDLLVRSGRDHDAVVVWSATESADSHTSYGAESDLVRAAVDTARSRLGTRDFEEARRAGERLGADGVLDHSIGLLTAGRG